MRANITRVQAELFYGLEVSWYSINQVNKEVSGFNRILKLDQILESVAGFCYCNWYFMQIRT